MKFGTWSVQVSLVIRKIIRKALNIKIHHKVNSHETNDTKFQKCLNKNKNVTKKQCKKTRKKQPNDKQQSTKHNTETIRTLKQYSSLLQIGGIIIMSALMLTYRTRTVLFLGHILFFLQQTNRQTYNLFVTTLNCYQTSDKQQFLHVCQQTIVKLVGQGQRYQLSLKSNLQ